MRPTSSVLESLFLSRLTRDQKDLLRMIVTWRDAVGRDLARVSRPRDYRRGCLTVAVASSLWQETFQENAPDLLHRLRERWPDIPLHRLAFVTEPRPAQIPPVRPRPGQALDPSIETRLQSMAAVIPDPRIRRHFIRVFRMLWQRKRTSPDETAPDAGNDS